MTAKARATGVAAVLVSSALACGCGGVSARQPLAKPRPPVVLTSNQATALRAYGAGDTAFGLNLLSALCHAQPGRNAVISPVSLATGLGMAYLGARGATATTMQRVLHLPATGRSLAAGLAARAALLAALNRPGITFAASMLAILPPAGQNAAGCELPAAGAVGSLAAGLLASHTQTDIALSKVKLASTYSLKGVLTSLGMGIAFGGGADFAGISPQACCIGFVQHAATLAVAEKGTVASAATAVGITQSAGRAAALVSFDRPYLLLLRDSLTGEPLMLAWVANPVSG